MGNTTPDARTTPHPARAGAKVLMGRAGMGLGGRPEDVGPQALARDAVLGFEQRASLGRNRPVALEKLVDELPAGAERPGQLRSVATGGGEDFIDDSHSVMVKHCRHTGQALVPPSIIAHTAAMLDKRSEAEILAVKVGHAIERSGLSPSEVAVACGVSRQAVNGWLRTGRIGKGNLRALAVLTEFPLWWWTDPTVRFDDYLRDGLDRPPVNQPNGLEPPAESMTNVTPITKHPDQPLLDALHPEQRRVVNEVTALLVATFTRWNRPPTGLDRGRWSASRSGKKGGGKRPPKGKKG